MHTVVELPEYLRRAARLLSEQARTAIVEYLAAQPKAGVIMQGTGGIRKFRWAREGMGKSGGVRDNLTKAEQNALRHLVRTLIETRRKHHG